MKDDKQVPTQVNVNLPTEFGGRRIQQLDIQGNRTDPNAEFNSYLVNQLAVPTRVSDILVDILLWVAASTFLASVGKQLSLLPGVPAIIAIVSAILVFLTIYILKSTTDTRIRWSLLYRWFLILVGVCLGVR